MDSAGRLFAVYAGAFVAFVMLLAILEQIGMSTMWLAYLFALVPLLGYAVIGIVTRTMQPSEYFVAGRAVPPLYNAMAGSAGWMSGALFASFGGTLYVLGQDGAALILGWSLGFVLLAVLIVPYLRKLGAYTIADFLAVRFGGNRARLFGVFVALVSSMAFLAAQFHAGGVILSHLLDMSLETGVILVAATVLSCTLLGGMRAVTWTQVSQFVVVMLAFLLPAAFVALAIYASPLPQFSYGQAVAEIATVEQAMAGRGLLSGSWRSFVEPFASLDPVNFVALLLALACGTATMPHLVNRYLTADGVHSARRGVAWTLVFVVIVLVTAPAYAAFAKLMIYESAIGADLTDLPAWIYTFGEQGLVSICGVQAQSEEAILNACASLQGSAGVLRSGDLSVRPELAVMALPEMLGLPFVFLGLLAAGAVAAAVSTASALLMALTATLGHDVLYRTLNPNASTQKRMLMARLVLIALVVLAAWSASRRTIDVLTITAWAFSLAAAGSFPAIVLGIWWKRCNTLGALSGMLAGIVVTGGYMVMTQYFGMAPAFGVNAMSSAVFGVPIGFAVTIAVALATRPPSKEIAQLVSEMRTPHGEPMLDLMREKKRAASASG